MDREGRYLNPSERTFSLVRHLVDPKIRAEIRSLYASLSDKAAEEVSRERRELQFQHRLEKVEVERLVSEYEAGSTVAELVARYQVNRSTVGAHLRRAGVTARTNKPKLSATDIHEIIELYASGQSLLVIGKKYGVNAETVRRKLTKAGVQMRPRGRRR